MACSTDLLSEISPNNETGLRDACGVFACVATKEWPTQLDVHVGQIIYLGLVGLQHRGQESAGIVTTDGLLTHKFNTKRGAGLVSTIFSEDDMKKLKGNLGIGHTRYSTAGGTDIINCQPFVVDTFHGLIALAHNGEIVNASRIRNQLLSRGVGLSTYSDSELITQLLTHPPTCGEPDGVNWSSRIKSMMLQAPLSYSLVILHKDKVYAVRDPFGNRPLSVGKLHHISSDVSGNTTDVIDGWVVSSESCSFSAVGATLHREVMPGEILEISAEGVRTLCIVPRPDERPPATCIFEYVYFSRPDSVMEGQMVYTVRKRCGAQLAKEAPINVDLVATVPESATPAALGYAEQLGLPYGEVLCKNRYVGRTFIQPSKRLRKLGVAQKFGPLVDNLQGKRIVIIDDSIVRGNTIAPIIKLLRSSGATEVHVRVASPPIRFPCFMGINIPTKEELIANQHKIEDLSGYIGADSLQYLSIDGLVLAVQSGITDKSTEHGHCTACLCGEYPVDPHSTW